MTKTTVRETAGRQRSHMAATPEEWQNEARLLSWQLFFQLMPDLVKGKSRVGSQGL